MEALYRTLTHNEKVRNESFVLEMDEAIESLFSEITKVNISDIQVPAGSNRLTVWVGVNKFFAPTRIYAVRFLLKGPDKGFVRGFDWFEKKGLKPLLSRLRDHFSPFEVYFKHAPNQSIEIVVGWP